MGTSRETELKLALAASGADKVERLPWLLRLSGGRVERRKLRAVYFDTRTLELHEQGLMLRVRHVDRQRLQTIKTSGAGASFERGEWDHEISGDTPDLKLAKHTPLAPLAKKKKLQRKLRPIFETMVASHDLSNPRRRHGIGGRGGSGLHPDTRTPPARAHQ